MTRRSLAALARRGAAGSAPSADKRSSPARFPGRGLGGSICFGVSESMCRWTKIMVAGRPGYLFYAVGDCKNLAFVPLQCIDAAGRLDRDEFLLGRWPWSNNFSNKISFWSHTWPDMERPAPQNADGLREFLERLAERIRGAH